MNPLRRFFASAGLRKSCRHLSVALTIAMALFFCFMNEDAANVEIPPQRAFLVLLVSQAVSSCLFGVPVVMAIAASPAVLKRWFSLQWFGWRALGRLFLQYLALVLGCAALLTVFQPGQPQEVVQVLANFTTAQRVVAAFLLCGLAPFLEECLFRGILLGCARPVVALPLSAACFAFAHGLNGFTAPLFFFGWFLGLLALRTRSLIPGILLHAAFNSLSLLAA